MDASIIAYLKERYCPLAIITYGSYSNHTNDLNSDYDALVICEPGKAGITHDTSVVNGVQLDVFLYEKDHFAKAPDFSEIVQIWDGKIELDTDGIAADWLNKVKEYISDQAVKTDDEKAELRQWCYKMAERTKRADTEGRFRWHWLLVDSLEIYCNVRDIYYFGPKKTLLRMNEDDEAGYGLYDQALKAPDALLPWIDHIFSESTSHVTIMEQVQRQ